MTITIPESERLDRLRLIRSENVGPITFRLLLERFGSAGGALRALPELSRRGGRKSAAAVCPKAAAEAELEAVTAAGARLVAPGEAGYPPLLAQIEDPPPLLCILGDPTLSTSRIAIAIVGARNASINGKRLVANLARDLGGAGLVVVSGLARGVDAAAHQAALAAGTVAVVAGGVDVIYPRENAELYREIAEHGLIVSELPPGVQPQARHFPRRNRLISGISLGVVVVEATLRSGSLITARRALDQGREVFAVPGSPLDPRARGPNDLLRQGAVLTETAEDVLNALNLPLRQSEAAEPHPPEAETPAPVATPAVPADGELEHARRVIAEALSPAPATVDDITRMCGLAPPVVAMVLMEWELAGRLERQLGNKVALLADA